MPGQFLTCFSIWLCVVESKEWSSEYCVGGPIGLVAKTVLRSSHLTLN